MTEKTQVYLVELGFDEDYDGEAILECCDPANYILIKQLPFETISEYEGNNMVDIEVDITDEDFLNVAKMAHERDITFNEMMNIIIEEQILRADD